MCSTPLISCSSGSATVSDNTSALAPGKYVLTATVGGVMLGVCSTGRPGSATRPRMTMTMEMTAAKIGRSMKKAENTR